MDHSNPDSGNSNNTGSLDPRWPSAERYVSWGWHVFVLGENKRPIPNCDACNPARGGTRHNPKDCDHLLCHGFYAATQDLARIDEMLRKIPNGQLAIATGAVSGVDVIDFESSSDREGEPTGLEVHDAWESWVADANDTWSLPRTRAAITVSGGLHLFYRHTPGAKSHNRVFPSVDVKSTGGYVAVPSGVGARRWVDAGLVVAEPIPMLARWFRTAKGRHAAKDGSKTPGDWRVTPNGGGRTFDWSILDEPSIPPGGQNWILYRAACSCRARRDEDARARRLLEDLVSKFVDQPGREPWGDPHDVAWTWWERVKVEIPEGSSEPPEGTLPEWEFIRLHQKAKERDWDLQELLKIQRTDDMRDFIRDVRRDRKMAENTPAWADVSDILRKFANGVTPQRPTVFSFTDATWLGLFYEGKGNVIYGDGELGKTWLMAACAAWFINHGEHVVWFAHDNMTQEDVVRRLLQVSAKPENIGEFFHIPGEPSTVVPAWDFHVSFVVLDSLNPTISMLGINANQTGDGMDTVIARYVQPFVDKGATVVLIDHENATGKQTGNRRKGHAVQGISLRLVEHIRGRQGSLTISAIHVEKDNPGGSGVVGEEAFGFLRVDGRGRADGGAYVTAVRDLPAKDAGEVVVTLSKDIAEKVFGNETTMENVRAFMAEVEHLISVYGVFAAMRKALKNLGQTGAADTLNEGNVGTYLSRLHKKGEIIGWQEEGGRRRWFYRRRLPGESGLAEGEVPATNTVEDEVGGPE